MSAFNKSIINGFFLLFFRFFFNFIRFFRGAFLYFSFF